MNRQPAPALCQALGPPGLWGAEPSALLPEADLPRASGFVVIFSCSEVAWRYGFPRDSAARIPKKVLQVLEAQAPSCRCPNLKGPFGHLWGSSFLFQRVRRRHTMAKVRGRARPQAPGSWPGAPPMTSSIFSAEVVSRALWVALLCLLGQRGKAGRREQPLPRLLMVTGKCALGLLFGGNGLACTWVSGVHCHSSLHPYHRLPPKKLKPLRPGSVGRP